MLVIGQAPDYPIIRRQRQRRGALLVVSQRFLAPAVHAPTPVGATPANTERQ